MLPRKGLWSVVVFAIACCFVACGVRANAQDVQTQVYIEANGFGSSGPVCTGPECGRPVLNAVGAVAHGAASIVREVATGVACGVERLASNRCCAPQVSYSHVVTCKTRVRGRLIYRR